MPEEAAGSSLQAPYSHLKGCRNLDKLSLLLWIIEVAAILEVSYGDVLLFYFLIFLILNS